MPNHECKEDRSRCGILYVVATPIGNLQDITQRAIQTLQSVDRIVAEDTRHSGILIHKLGIKKPIISLHVHNEHEKSASIVQEILSGFSYALISDAGTPLISDPGFKLVTTAKKSNIRVIPIPGACALITALSAAGVPCDKFIFSGFLAAKRPMRCTQLQLLCSKGLTVVIYEATHRIQACVEDISAVYGPTYNFTIAKELTKVHECFLSGTASEIQHWLQEKSVHTQGEFVVLLPPLITTENFDLTKAKQLLDILIKELPLSKAVIIAAKLSTIPKNILYSLAVELK